MYAAFLEKTLRSIDALRRHLSTSDLLRSVIHENLPICKGEKICFSQAIPSIDTAPDRLEWRVIDHCAAVTRIYAIYEQFAQEMIRGHISLLQRHLPYSKLPNDLQNSYRRGVATILEKRDGPRYGHLDISKLIQQYGLALSDKEYVLEPLALLMQEQNLRLPELTRLLTGCGIGNMTSWIEKHQSIRNFFDKEERLAATAEHEMRELIKYRNDAAHGSINIDELPGLDYLYEFCDFVGAVCEAMAERVQLTGLECLIESKAAVLHGKVTECLKSGKVVIAKVTGHFKVGDTIYLCGNDYCIAGEVNSIQAKNVSHTELTVLEVTELGIGINRTGRSKAEIISIFPVEVEPIAAPLDDAKDFVVPMILDIELGS
jgi:hypothetical protein